MAFQVARLVAVLALLGVAAAIATPKGRLPLALRGLEKMLRKDAGRPAQGPVAPPSRARRLAAFALVLLAVLAALV